MMKLTHYSEEIVNGFIDHRNRIIQKHKAKEIRNDEKQEKGNMVQTIIMCVVLAIVSVCVLLLSVPSVF